MIRRRRSARGAALVEAAVVIPVMLVFLGLIIWTHDSYEAKLDKQMSTRASVMYFASHACEGDTPPEIESQGVMSAAGSMSTSSSSSGIGNGNISSASGRIGSAGQSAGVSQDAFMVHAAQDSSVDGTAINDRQTVSLHRSIHAESEVGCNEKRFDENWFSAIWDYGKEFFGSHGGIF